eukprot:4438360-Karenia_brevis.AAC.1
MVIKLVELTYYAVSRIRAKLQHFRLYGIAATLDRRVMNNFRLIQSWCHPRVHASYLRTLWNGWTTLQRMRNLQGFQ